MSEQNFITIPCPEGFEQCKPRQATHVLCGRDSIFWIDRSNFDYVVYVNMATKKYQRQSDMVGITAYLRELPKQEPFRVVTIGTAFSTLDRLEPNGERHERFFLSVGEVGLKDGQQYRIIITEEKPNSEVTPEKAFIPGQVGGLLPSCKCNEVFTPDKVSYKVGGRLPSCKCEEPKFGETKGTI
jgi:hypothetical protein